MSQNETKSQSGSMEKAPTPSIHDELPNKSMSQIDLLAYHEHNAGRLVVDPEYVVVYDKLALVGALIHF